MAVIEARVALGEMGAQAYLQSYYPKRTDHGASNSRGVPGDQSIREAEASRRATPQAAVQL